MSQARKVTYARLHATTFVPGLGNLKETLPPQDKSCDMHLTWTGSELVGSATFQGRNISFGIPSSAVQIMVFAPEDKPAVTFATKATTEAA